MRFLVCSIMVACCSMRAQDLPREDIRLKPEFLAEFTAYKKDFRLPDWAKQGRARQIRWDGGPMFAACQIECPRDYLLEPEAPGFVGLIRGVWTLTNLYTEDVERRLDEIRNAGYNWIWASYQLGFAFKDEERQRAQVRRLIGLAHERGIKVTAYFSLTSVFSRSAFVNEPQSKSWIQEDAGGGPVAYAGVSVRPMACVNKPGRIDYLKRIVRLAVEDGADDIFWDSVFNRCYCGHCRRSFRAYSERVLGKPLEIPVGHAVPQAIGMQEDTATGGGAGTAYALFTEHAHYTVARAIAELDKHAKTFNPRVTVSVNTHKMRYLDEVADIVWSEDSNHKGGSIKNGRLITPLGVYAWCQAVARGRESIQLTVAPSDWQPRPPEYYETTIADAAGFQANFVMRAGYAFSVLFRHNDPVALRAWEGISRGLRFIEKNQILFEDATPLADVAVYFSQPTRIQNDLERRSPLWESAVQSLFQAGIPTRVLTDQAAIASGPQALARDFRLIVLPGVSCLADAEVNLLRRYVEAGGKLLLSTDTGAFTSFWVRRGRAPWEGGGAGIAVVPSDAFREPARLAAASGTLLNRKAMVHIGGNGFQIGNPVLHPDGIIVHLVNYTSDSPQRALQVRLSAVGYSKLEATVAHDGTARWLTPDSPEGLSLPVTWHGGDASVTIPELRVSGLLVLRRK